MFCTEVIISSGYTDKKQTQYDICKKCDCEFRLDWGGLSKTTSCRVHRGKTVCKDCHLKFPIDGNCYHSRKTWWDFFFGWIKI